MKGVIGGSKNENLYSIYSYPLSVTMQIDQDDRESYLVAAEKLNKCRKTKAVCLQHEIDHLDGKVFVEYLSQLKLSRIKAKLAKQARITA